jgi:hypothetical protein
MICISRRSLARIARSRSIVSAARQFIEDLLALETREALELHVEDCLRLNLRKTEVRPSILRALPAASSTSEST